MTTVTNYIEPVITYTTTRWEIVDMYGYVLDEVAVEVPSDMPESDMMQVALCEYASQIRDGYEPNDYKADVVINSISHARML